MNFKTMTAVSVLTLALSSYAYAADVPVVGVSSQAEVSANVASDAAVTRADINTFFLGEGKTDKFTPVIIRRGLTADGLIGETIVSAKGDKVGTIKDIIINQKGQAILVVVSDSGPLSIGDKVAAFDYNKVIAQNTDGDVLMSLSQDMIDRAADFSYDSKDWAKAKVIPSGSQSVNTLLKGDVLDSNGRKVADIENVYFRNDGVSQIIVGFNKTLGLGGDTAALSYNDLQMRKDDGDLDFKLTANQSAQFKNFKKSIAN